MLTINELPLLIENHLINPIDGKLKYLIEVSYYNILGKTVEEKNKLQIEFIFLETVESQNKLF